MRFREEKVRLDAIDSNNHTFLLTTEKCVDTLAVSIKSIGLIHPPLLIKKKTSYQIVSGFRRISALTSISVSEVDAWILNDTYDIREASKIAISENAFQRPR